MYRFSKQDFSYCERHPRYLQPIKITEVKVIAIFLNVKTQSCIFVYRKYQYKNEIVSRRNIVIYMDCDCGFYICELCIYI